MIRLIISDIDGTLVPEGGSRVNPEYMDVIRRLTEHGVVFAAASGRQSTSIDAVFYELRDRIYYLSDNGAYIQKYGKDAKIVRMRREDILALLDELKGFSGYYLLLSAKEGYYTADKDPEFCRLVFDQYQGTGSVVDNILDYVDGCIKLSLYCINGAEEFYDLLYERWKDRFIINISGERWLDINDFASTKGNAVQWIQEQLGITPKETVVFGDNFNDISMMKRAARSYASVLSHPDVKKEARYEVASYEEDGVLQVLKQLLEEIENEK